MVRLRRVAVAFFVALAFVSTVPVVHAEELIARFSGDWIGTGQLLFGPQYGQEFHCELNGKPSASQMRFDMRGRCWSGLLSAPVTAQLRYNAETRQYYGAFMDGAEGQGADIVGARDGEAISLKLMRGALQGRLVAETVNADQMKVMMFYRDVPNDRELPVVAMGFARKGATDKLPDYLPDFVTGSIKPKN